MLGNLLNYLEAIDLYTENWVDLIVCKLYLSEVV